MVKHLTLLLTLAFLALSSEQVNACSPIKPLPPSTDAAFREAKNVVHVRVLAQQVKRDRFFAQIELLETLKGQFPERVLETSNSAACGIGEFKLGAEYVFFFSDDLVFVSHLVQPPQSSTEKILKEVRVAMKGM
jgi:hypothetical protein